MKKRVLIWLFACCCLLVLIVVTLNTNLTSREEPKSIAVAESSLVGFQFGRKANFGDEEVKFGKNEVDDRFADSLLEALYGEERKKMVQTKLYQQHFISMRNDNGSIAMNPLNDTPRSNIIIITNRRSGSSFLGQIFNQNPQIYFHYEPLKSVEQLLSQNQDNFTSRAVELLRQIFKCDFSNPSRYLKAYINFLNNPNNGLHRLSSNVLVRPPYCSPKATKSHEQGFSRSAIMKKLCFSLSLQNFRDLCNRYQKIVVKAIRLSDINVLKPLLEDRELNLKILHLVRDPRAIFNSRANSEKFPKVYEEKRKMTEALCQRMNLNIEKGDKLAESGRYMRVRFEDIAMDPDEMAKRIYNFSYQQDLPLDVKVWLKENTKDDPQKITNKNSLTYSTKRNSSHIAQAWRWELPFETSFAIQNSKNCRQVMSRLSYREVESHRQLTDFSFSLV